MSSASNRRSRLLAALVVGFAVRTPPVLAQSPAPIALEWSAPPECPDRTAILDEVRQLAPASSSSTAIVRGDITPTTTGHWRVHLITVIDSNIGERTIDADTCIAAAHATAVMLGLALTSAASAAPPVAAMEVEVQPPIAIAPASQRTWQAHTALFGGADADVGTLPGLSAGLHVGAALRLPSARFELFGTYFPSQHAEIGNGFGADVSLFSATVRGCWIRAWEHVEAGACGGIEVGAMQASGTGNSVVPVSTTSAWLATLGAFTFAWAPVEHLALRFDAGPGILLFAPALQISDSGSADTVFQPSIVFGRAMISVELRL